MRIVAYVIILVSLLFAPVQSGEIAKLEPIQAVWLRTEGETVCLTTDTGDEGSGTTVEDALTDMKATSAGIVYLDTAQYLLVSQSAVNKIPAIGPYLRKSIRLYLWDGQGNFDEAVKYAEAHKFGITVKQWNSGEELKKIPTKKEKIALFSAGFPLGKSM